MFATLDSCITSLVHHSAFTLVAFPPRLTCSSPGVFRAAAMMRMGLSATEAYSRFWIVDDKVCPCGWFALACQPQSARRAIRRGGHNLQCTHACASLCTMWPLNCLPLFCSACMAGSRDVFKARSLRCTAQLCTALRKCRSCLSIASVSVSVSVSVSLSVCL